jgi:dTDP-glucose pyrophosphorylase
MINKEILIEKSEPLKQALIKLNANPHFKTLLVLSDDKLVGTITDGDIRRGLIEGLSNANTVADFMQTTFTYLSAGEYNKAKLDFITKNSIKIVPVLNKDNTLNRVLDFNKVKTILPIDAVIMAGGVGSRLMPLTKDVPKPMLLVGGKPIMEYNVDLLRSFGISNLTLSVKYLKEVIQDYYQDGASKEMAINYITEDEPLGTIGAVNQIKEFYNDYVLVMNSDLLTNLNLAKMFEELTNNKADMIVATTDYQVKIPYGVIESDGNQIIALKEKPTYTYYSNAGIYIFKKELTKLIPKDTYFNATDFLEKLMAEGKKVLHYPIKQYWLDIGKHADYEQAQKDILNVSF